MPVQTWAWIGLAVLGGALAGVAGGLAWGVLSAGVMGLAVTALARRVTGDRRRIEGDVFALLGPPEPGEVAGAPNLDADLRALGQKLWATHRDLQRAEALLAATPTGVLITDEEGRIERVNNAFRAMIPPRREPIGLTPLEAVGVIDVQELVDLGRSHETPDERVAVSGDLDVALTAVPLFPGVAVLARDITRARLAERARTDFVANVSHELRTPIAAIRGYAETLLDAPEDLPDDALSMVRVIERNARRLSQLFDDLLTLYRIEARRRELPRDMQLVAPILQRAVASPADVASAKGQRFTLDCPDLLEAWVNPEALSAIVGNLASNATKYTPEGGSITVRARAEGDGEARSVVVEVSDDGPGIPKAHQDRVFERFYRVDDGRARQAGGTGLGLAIVKHLAQACGARITVSSEEGQGSCFALSLPATTPKVHANRTWSETL